ncbi:MAG: MarR family transcriptional regulator [Oscillospiraceae bacterium]|nr:MarR family transcriptional regulator [Oscillospiraceae bacterium]
MFPIMTLLNEDVPHSCRRLSEDEYSRFILDLQKLCNLDLGSFIIGMTPGELALMYHAELYSRLSGGGMLTVAEMAERLHVSVPAISRTLKNLESKGFVERVADESDRRSVLISVMEIGREMLMSNLRRSADVMDKALSKFSDEELRSMARLQNKFVTEISDILSETNSITEKGTDNA